MEPTTAQRCRWLGRKALLADVRVDRTKPKPGRLATGPTETRPASELRPNVPLNGTRAWELPVAVCRLRDVGMHIGHLALRATDTDKSATFLTEILGLRRTDEDGGLVNLSTNEKHHEIQLVPGEQAGVDHLGLEVEDERDLDTLRDAAIAAGAHILSETPQEAGIDQAIRLVGPLDLVFELYTGMEREPLSVEHYMPPLARRFGHVTFSTNERAEMERFLIDVLGFRVTDSLGDRVSWLRCDFDHHGVALVDAETTRLHHYAFELENWGAIERYCDHLAFLGQRLVWGPGRHGPGRNLYTYLPDPDNTIVEAYADLLQVVDEANYRPIDWSERGETALNLWGPMPPANWRDYGVPILTPEIASAPSQTGGS